MSKETFLSVYREHITRPGSAELLAYLEKSDFFSAPASSRFHGDHDGGLCEHSVNVYQRLAMLISAEDLIYGKTEYSEETIAICGLLHDLCKVGFYTTSTRNVKNEQTGQWEKKPYYTVEDKLPYGHGEKSVFMIERFMRLSTEEAMAIRWHMGGFDESAQGGSYAISNAYEKYPLAVMLHIADLQATYINEKKENNK